MFRKELFLSFDTVKISRIEELLSSAGIPCDLRSIDFGRADRGSALFGKAGPNPNQRIMYYVYVRARDYEKARWILARNGI